MKRAAVTAIAGSLVLLTAPWPSATQAALGPGAPHGVDFRGDDPRGQRIARQIFAKQIAEDEASSEASYLRTAWVNVSDSKSPTLLVMYGCSPTGNCGLFGFERSKKGWRLVLDSIAQTCAILPSSHGGRRDISASMHGSATESTLKTYWWRKDRYVRVSRREVIYDR